MRTRHAEVMKLFKDRAISIGLRKDDEDTLVTLSFEDWDDAHSVFEWLAAITGDNLEKHKDSVDETINLIWNDWS